MDTDLKFAIVGSRGFPSSYGGFETLVRRLAPYLANRGHEVLVYGRTDFAPTSDEIPIGVSVKTTFGIDLKSASTLTYGYTAVRDIGHQKIDAALVLNVANGFFLPKLKRLNVPTCVNVDGIEWQRGKWGKVAQSVFLRGAKITASTADSLIFDSEEIAAIWRCEFGRTGNFIPYGADILTDVGTEKLLEIGIEPQKYLLVVARIIPENNVELLLDAIEQLSFNPLTVIVGDGNYKNPTLQKLRTLHDQAKILWLGHVRDQELLSQLWANSLLYWHGHSVGGTNPALLQALGAGSPVLALDTKFNREVIRDDRQLIDGDPSLLAAAISQFLSDESLRKEVAVEGKETVRERYGWAAVCEAYLSVLESLVSVGQ
ncbi:MAG: glycosyltransferase [Nitrososphaerales archaeon]